MAEDLVAGGGLSGSHPLPLDDATICKCQLLPDVQRPSNKSRLGPRPPFPVLISSRLYYAEFTPLLVSSSVPDCTSSDASFVMHVSAARVQSLDAYRIHT